MNLLILGGTIFLGRHLVELALSRGHEVTLFNRGQHNADLFPEAEKLRGDRDGNLNALRNRRWDAVIDTCGYVPRIVRDSARLLADAAGHYTFISSIAVYADASKPGLDEDSPLGRLDDQTVEEVTGDTYGPLKALCERAAEEAMPGRVLNIRPGLIIGPHDPTDRFTYWPCRLARGGDVLAPGWSNAPVQVIDVRDLAEWNLDMIEAGHSGAYNATGPGRDLTMEGTLETCMKATNSSATLNWVGESFLLEQGVEPWIELPLWLPGDEHAGLLAVSISKALKSGLTHRPLSETARDTLDWAETRPADHRWQAGLSQERELELLSAFRTI